MRDQVRALLELVRAPAAVSVPGDTLAGAAGARRPAVYGLALASTLLYWAGMALNDWSDREVDAVERPERPIPSQRVTPGAALGVAVGLTAGGLAAAALAGGRRSLTLAGLLAGCVWSYDLLLKGTAAAPAAMAACRTLDVLLGAGERTRRAAPMALAIGAHTYGISVLGRAEVKGAGRGTADAALIATATAATLTAFACLPSHRPADLPRGTTRPVPRQAGATGGSGGTAEAVGTVLAGVLLVGYAGAAARTQAGLRADPSPERVREAVRTAILALIPLQAAVIARQGRLTQATALLAALPAGRALSARMATS
ncbi:SCO3242 family prenyltransferase [Nonomuraea glycinis]|uniref:SCO3242 family prenyltransferase n=1 Tax=Nonomuraea glycinis TaxID=2047744 RepID=UPI002E139C04|nr:UbiA family prenyltransferase [Nonomuraea glycinis]